MKQKVTLKLKLGAAEWRQLIIPAYFQGMSLRRLAAHLHVPLGIVKSRLHNGM